MGNDRSPTLKFDNKMLKIKVYHYLVVTPKAKSISELQHISNHITSTEKIWDIWEKIWEIQELWEI